MPQANLGNGIKSSKEVIICDLKKQALNHRGYQTQAETYIEDRKEKVTKSLSEIREYAKFYYSTLPEWEKSKGTDVELLAAMLWESFISKGE